MLRKLNLEFPEVTAEQLSNWTSDHDDGVKNLEWKIRAYSERITDSKLRQIRDRWIHAHIRVTNALNHLRDRSKPIWEHLEKLRRASEHQLALCLTQTNAPADVIKEAARELSEAMRRDIDTLDLADAKALSDGIVADWLQICSLLPKDDDNPN